MDDAQGKYQVRFDWGAAGYESLGRVADAVIVADGLPSTGHGAGARRMEEALGQGSPMRGDLVATLNNRKAVAEWVLARQAEKGGRFSVAVIAAGEHRVDGTFRWAVEDQLAAGALIDALSDLGIDHCSPEAAAASAAFVGLKQALKHLVSASETGQLLAAVGRRDEVAAACRLDSSAEVSAAGP